MGLIKDATPTINDKLIILLPTKFPKLIIPSFFIEAEIAIESSGKLVPIATNVIPIIKSLVPKCLAILVAPLTTNSAPIIIAAKLKINITKS